jgi:DNA-binding transcriptional LysR family regulator
MLLTDAGRQVLALSGRVEAAMTDCESSLEIKQAVIAGLGIAFISAHTVATNSMSGGW